MSVKLQAKIFEDVLGRYPKRSAAVEELAELFGLQKDAVYRRLRGDTFLTPDEMTLLAKKYRLSIDAYISDDPDAVFFSFTPFSNTVKNVGDYLNGVLDDLNQVTHLPDVKVYFVSYEIPFFYYSFFKELISFKLYIWGKTVWEFDYLKDRPFDLDIISYPDEKVIEDLLKSFLQLDTVELWSVNIIDNTLNQIEYCVSSGNFKNSEDAFVLCDRMKDLVGQWRIMAEHGRKFPLGNYGEEHAKGTFELYQQELLITSNTILVTSPVGKVIFPIISNPNYLRSTDQRMCDYQEAWFKKAVGKSIPISQQNEKARAQFFNIMERKIAATRRRIESHLDEF